MFFKGYVLTQNKKCIEKFKGRTSFKSYAEVKELPEFAGILAEKTVLVDIDDFEQSEILSRLFKKNSFVVGCIKQPGASTSYSTILI